MPDILHRVGIRTTPDRVFESVSTIDGLAHWWTTEAKGEPRQGGTIDFGFSAMQVMESRPNSLVHWKCVRGPEGWVGTEVSFQLKPEGDQTWVIFRHAGWKEPIEFMHHCSTKWAVFLLSMRDWLERGEGRPAPYDIKIHVGD